MQLLVVLLFMLLKSSFCDFVVPDAKVEVFRPRGLRVSIPDRDGIKLFAFHGQVNKEMNGREGGTFSKDILKAKDGRWTFYDPYARLKEGDTLYYWTYVDYFDGVNKLGYTNDDKKFVVKELLDKENGTPVTPKQPEEVTERGGCKKSATRVNNEEKCSEEVILDENFNSFQKSLWSPEVKFAGSPDFEFVVYTDSPETLEVKKSHLKIRPIFSDLLYGQDYVTRQHQVDLGIKCTGAQGTLDCVQQPDAFLILPPVASAQITTKNKFSFKFGKIEIRAKLPKGDWIYPQLFLNPAAEEYGPGYASGQIRLAFLPGNENLNRNLQGGCILGKSRSGRNFGMKTIRKSRGTWCDGYHKFGVLWKPDQITLTVDDTVYGNIYAPEGGFVSESPNLELGDVDRWRSGTRFAPFDKEMYLTVGVGVGGHSFEDNVNSKPWQNSEPKAQKKFYKASSRWLPTWTNASVLDVDYIKIWAL